jgi:hypothetical protein
MSAMNPPHDELEDLLNGLLDKTLSTADETRLVGMLAVSAEARGRYRKWIEIHAALHWDYAGAATHVPESKVRDGLALSAPLETNGIREADQRAFIGSLRLARRSLVVGGSLAAAGLLTLAIGWSALIQLRLGDTGRAASATSPRVMDAIVEVASLDGAASWSDGHTVLSNLAVGHKLSAGMVSLEGESAFLTLRFDDGTAVTMTGESMLEFAARWHKSVVLRHGTLSVDAQPQPPGRPMLIRTPTAEVEVVGTILSVTADSGETKLGVGEGSVRLQRLADGQTVEVPEHHMATASLVTLQPMAATRASQLPSSYRQTFDGTPCLRCRGKWMDADDRLPSRARAVPFVADRGADGKPIVHYGMTVRDQDQGFVALHDDSVVAVQFRCATPSPLQVMIGIRGPGGSFAGNFEANIHTDSVATETDRGDDGANGWRWLEIPSCKFIPSCKDYPDLTPGLSVGMLLVDTLSSDASLEVAEVFVSRQVARADSE